MVLRLSSSISFFCLSLLTCIRYLAMELVKIFDLILRVAVEVDLKPEKMIKKLVVFTYCIPSRFYDSCAWDTKYGAIQRMFKDNWNISNWNSPSIDLPLIDSPRPGVTPLGGWFNNLVKSFLYIGGDFRPHHLMEAAIADKEYQILAVVD
ncbi:uncharacterized protein Pyn_12261 [Prunus yedoensis var. nudiflora]|uniref:DUF7788 domain-containing protein n=1 Tax=Prunus yedoensis var. nudiflora TaxID=2094558 RepID=A0A314UV48_PRUYE|nr:uncharacterized protein Pyn_12261 [Prunus yedoensis var. nudiflora]